MVSPLYINLYIYMYKHSAKIKKILAYTRTQEAEVFLEEEVDKVERKIYYLLWQELRFRH